MKTKRAENAARNIVYGLLLRLYQILMPFLMRSAILWFLGVEYLGLGSLFSSILQILNLAELGVGSAMVYSMYEPIVKEDTQMICALLKLYRKYYRIIGLFICVTGLILMPFLPQMIRNDIPGDLNLYILYLLNLAATVLSYLFFAYRASILVAMQRSDIISKINLASSTLMYVFQICALALMKNYYIYFAGSLLAQLLNNISAAVIAGKRYPDYIPHGNTDKKIRERIGQRIRDLFTSRLGYVIVNSADAIVISAFLGLKLLAVYQNYFFILSSISGFILVIFQSCTAGIGNSLITETKEKNYGDLKVFSFLIQWAAGFCTCCMFCLYQPFMTLWVGEELKLKFSAVICFCIYFYVYEINQLLNTYKDAAGIWHKDRFRTLVTALTNLVMNLLTVRYWGIYGVILSTVISTVCIGMPWLLWNLFTTLFPKDYLKSYLKNILNHSAVTAAVCVICYHVCNMVKSIGVGGFIIRISLCAFIPNLLFWTVYRKRNEFSRSILLLDRLTGKKLRLYNVFHINRG